MFSRWRRQVRQCDDFQIKRAVSVECRDRPPHPRASVRRRRNVRRPCPSHRRDSDMHVASFRLNSPSTTRLCHYRSKRQGGEVARRYVATSSRFVAIVGSRRNGVGGRPIRIPLGKRRAGFFAPSPRVHAAVTADLRSQRHFARRNQIRTRPRHGSWPSLPSG